MGGVYRIALSVRITLPQCERNPAPSVEQHQRWLHILGIRSRTRNALAAAPPDKNADATAKFLWDVHKYTNDYIRFADTKAAFVAAASTALIGTLVGSNVLDSCHRPPNPAKPPNAANAP
jgi:hypothetical protein